MTGSSNLKSLFVAAVASVVFAASPAVASSHGGKAHSAGDHVIETRQDLMQGVKAGAKAAGAMVKGEKAFDAKEAALAMWAVYGSTTAFGHQFPAGSDKGDTRAKPEIWKDKKAFDAGVAMLAKSSMAAMKAAGESEAAFKAAFMKVGGTCKECHSTFRAKRK